MRAPTVYTPDALFADGVLRWGASLYVDEDGMVLAEAPADARVVRLPRRIMVPGFVNAHSHAFQRVLRGRTEFLAAGHDADDFWSWRELMYRAANELSPEQLYAVSRQTFLEMVLAGITTVGEFHYLHHQSDGTPYDDAQLLAKQVVRAARDVGLRIVLLRVGYARAGFNVAPNPRQRRFIDPDVDTFLRRVTDLEQELAGDPLVSVGWAPHSVRAVPRSWLERIAKEAGTRPLHLHVAEQPAELTACRAETGLHPVDLLEETGVLRASLTAVHAVHLDSTHVAKLGAAKTTVCACPSTERNLGDGIVRADELLAAGAHVAFGSDSQAHIDPLQEAQQLEGHLRLLRLRRNVLDSGRGEPSALAARLLHLATAGGARSLGVATGALRAGEPADFVTFDLEHPTLVGTPHDSMLAALILGANHSAVREVSVAGQVLVRDGVHPLGSLVTQHYRKALETLAG